MSKHLGPYSSLSTTAHNFGRNIMAVVGVSFILLGVVVFLFSLPKIIHFVYENFSFLAVLKTKKLLHFLLQSPNTI